MSAPGTVEVEVGGRAVRLTSLDRVLWPEARVTKASMIDYYARVAPVLLPHLTGRPLTLHRFPEGVEGAHFYQTRCPPRPEWVRLQRMYTFRRSGKEVDACVVDDLAGLVWAANLSAIELHPYLGVVDDLDTPTVAVFDLDPGPPAGILDAASVALAVREVLAAVGLSAWAKTSGAKGLHVYVPFNTPVTYDETKALARGVAAVLARDDDGVIDRMDRARRAGRVFVDWSQNDAGKSTVAPYSLRGGAVPTVSTPVSWEEVATAVADADPARLLFDPGAVVARIERHGDLFEPVLTRRQSPPARGPR